MIFLFHGVSNSGALFIGEPNGKKSKKKRGKRRESLIF